MRAQVTVEVTDGNGNVVAGARVQIREVGTETPVPDLYLDPEGGTVLPTAELVSDSRGIARAWIEDSRYTDGWVTDNGGTAFYPQNPAVKLTFAGFTVENIAPDEPDEPRPPTPHGETHGDGGTDPITGLATTGALDDETAARVAGDEALAEGLAAETAARIEADADEAAEREDADEAEATARGAAALVTADDLNRLYEHVDRLFAGYSQDTQVVDLGIPAAVAAQSTAFGKRIHGLRGFGGRMFLEYGDWNANTGPIKLVAWNPATSSFVEEHELATEQVRYRIVNGELWALSLDPRGVNPPTLARRAVGGGWTDIRLPDEPVHVMDAAPLDGVIYLAVQADDPASNNYDATVWASGDGGATWEVERVIPPVVSPPNSAGLARPYFLAVVGGSLYVEPYHEQLRPYGGTRGVAERLDGATWDEAPSLLEPAEDVGWDGYYRPSGDKPQNFTSGPHVGWVLYLGSFRRSSRITTLQAYDGTERFTVRRGVRDFLVAGSQLFVLDLFGKVETLRNFADADALRSPVWSPSVFGPSGTVENANSLGQVGGYTYVGGRDGHLWRGVFVSV